MSETTGVARSQWQTADPVRQICRNDFDAAGLPKYSPHSIRRTLVTLGQQRCRTPEAFKGWSQNIGHEDVMTTFRSYRAISELRQAELMSELRGDELDAPSARDRRVAKLLAAELRDAEQASRNLGGKR